MLGLGLQAVRQRLFRVVVEVDAFALGTRPHAHFGGADLELTEIGVRVALWILALED
jgi:hypothetical protein